MDNAKNPQYSILNRYGKNGSIFWRNFYEQSLNSTSNKILTSDLSGTTSFGDSTLGSYDKKKTSIECIANDWNEFISKITNNEDAKMITNSFLRYA
ncbi:MAG: hypothetical protein PHY44_07210 [Lachnospiraceae bacterium]|nr:hypothetical protein [Lachnospiraceae bacterium]